MHVTTIRTSRDYTGAAGAAIAIDVTVDGSKPALERLAATRVLVNGGQEHKGGEDFLFTSPPLNVGDVVTIKSAVADLSPNTNRSTVEYSLSGGAAPVSFSVSGEVTENGKPIIYETVLTLV